MLNIKRLRNEFDQVKKELLKRGKEYNLEKFTHLDIKKRELLQKVEDLKNKQNIVSKEIPILKKGGKDVTQIMSEMKDLPETIKDIDIKIGDEVIIFGESNINADNIAKDLGTINYEIVCMVSRRVDRIYKERNVILQADSYLVKLKR